jgi:hypothetical protein
MVAQDKIQLQAPGGSWESIKKIIRAYYAVADEENPTVERVAQLAGVHRPVVSTNNNFLRSAGILQEAANKLTPAGARLATGISINNQPLVSSALQEIVRSQDGLNHLVSLLKARSSMSLDAFRGEMVMVTGLDANSRNLQFLKAIVDLLVESMLVNLDNEELTFSGIQIGEARRVNPAKEAPVKTGEVARSKDTTSKTVPIPLGVGRLVHVELPDDWSSRDLPKLLKMLELSLGSEEEAK